MVKIMSDSSSIITVEEGKKMDIIINPLCVTINEKTYLEMEEIQPDEFLEIIAQGHLPLSSQPSIGQTLAHYEENGDNQLLNITMTDGLSGTYQTAMGAVQILEEKFQKNITVINSKAVWAPQYYMVMKAARLAKEGKSVTEIIEAITPSIDNNSAFLIPNDFDYLKRNGRLAPLAANVGGILKLVPLMIQSKDGKRIEKHALCRTYKSACELIIKYYKKININSNYILYVSHANVPKLAEQMKSMLSEAFAKVEIQTFNLSPSMITQGGPGCIAIQYVLKG